uniref:Anoctamin n=1 Tax=Syphacia muris TaxID=451379 RepID=A0A0N5ALD3_9BILA
MIAAKSLLLSDTVFGARQSMNCILCQQEDNVTDVLNVHYSDRNDLPLYVYLISTVLLTIVLAEIGLLLFALWLNIAEQRRGELPLCLKAQHKIEILRRLPLRYQKLQ